MTMILGEMEILGEPPAKLLKALAVIAARLHPSFDALPWIKPGISKSSCVLCSLAVRDFLFRIGFTDAEVAPVLMAVRAFRDGKELHTLGIGTTDLREAATAKVKWPGHLIVRLPTTGYLIDTTLYQARRQHWQHLAGMMAAPLATEVDDRPFGLRPIVGLSLTAPDKAEVEMWWLDQPGNKFWRRGGDAGPRRRLDVVNSMVREFGTWRDEA